MASDNPSDPFFDQAPLPLAILNPDFRIVRVNAGFAALLGSSAEELRGRSYSELTHPDDLAGEIAAWLRLDQRADAISLAKRFVHRDGSPVPVLIRVSAITGEAGRLGIMLCVVPDAGMAGAVTTPAGGSEGDELAHARRDLEYIATLMSHDLRQQIRMVTAFLSVLDQRHAAQLDPRGREFLATIRGHADDLARSLAGMGEYLRAGLARGGLVACASSKALATALAELATEIAASGTQVTSAELPEITADPAQLAMIFRQLIANAVMHGGRSSLRLHVTCERAGAAWEFAVADDGEGIPPEFHERVFQPFFACPVADGRKAGVGLGLALCRAAVERHGGRIWIDAAAEAGTVVRFSVPVVAVDAAA